VGKVQCPYNRKSTRYVKQYKNDLISEDIGIIKGCEEVVVEEYTLMDCLQSECGAYGNDKCNFNQGVNI